MSEKIGTPKQTAGGGFAFEDKVVGYYLVWMLAGTAPFAKAKIDRIDCQVAADGWVGFDDLLITLTDKGRLCRYAFSLKSNLQFGKQSAPSTLVRSAWSLFLHHHSNVMEIETDAIGLVCVPHPEPPKGAIQSLLRKARSNMPIQLSARLPVRGYASDAERRIHNSFSCPDDLAMGLKEEQRLAGNILKRMLVIELDFENPESSSEATVLFVCSELVADEKSATALNLWNALCKTAQRVRTAGGGITREGLLSEIRSIVELRELPDFSEDWHCLEAWRNTELSAIPDRVAGMTNVNRDDVTEKVMNSLQAARFVSVIGASGTGKTVIAKRVAEESREIGSVLWLKGERMRPGYVEALGSLHQLRHTLKDVLRHGKSESGLIVLDSAERLLNETDFSEICLLLHILEMEREGSVWRFMVTCREEAWEQVQLGLMRAFGKIMQWEPVKVDYPDLGALTSVWTAFPALRTLALRPHLEQVMRNLKVLDLLASAINMGLNPQARSWVGESDLIRWYWKHMVGRNNEGNHRDILLRKLGAIHADTGRFETPINELTHDELTLVGNSSDILGIDGERGMVFFVNDLIADWARFQEIVSHEGNLARYCEYRFSNPHWHGAFRLYGVSLLEADTTADKWKAAIAACPEGKDRFLESLVFAGNSQELINRAWLALIKEEGSLLKAFLKRFQHIASIPNPQYINLVPQMKAVSEEARTWERIPLWMYWLGVLYALAGHVVDLLKITPIETARLARSWLRNTPRDWLGRQQAATLAIAVAQQAIHTGLHYYHNSNDGPLPYMALLEAYPDKPDTVRELLLKAAARKVPTKEDEEAFEDYETPGTVMHAQSMLHGGDRIAQEPWPDGPLHRVDSAFRAACFETDALHSVMTDAPGLANEIILALLIERRLQKEEPDCSSRHMSLPEAVVCLEHDRRFYPPFYTKGPFLMFLKVNPEAALETIIRLIDFATERWMERDCREKTRRQGIDLPLYGGFKHFVGDGHVYHWYHGYSHTNIVSSALMAVEKWLYDFLEKKESIDGWLDLILKTSHSTAFLGVLSEVGRHSPELFSDSLRPLILVPNTYYFETTYIDHRIGPSAANGVYFFRLASDWNTMVHRKRRLLDLAAYFFHQHAETHKALLSAREQWKELPDEGCELWPRYKQILIATFDDQNWKGVKRPDGSKVIEFKEPEHLRRLPDQLVQSTKQRFLLTLPLKCRDILKEGKPLDSGQLPAFISKSKELLGFNPNDEEASSISPAANGILGMIAVVFVLHRDWLRANPEEEKWCVTMLDRTLTAPPPWPKFDMRESISDHDWEHFACDIASVIWAEDPANRASRERVARLAFSKHYSAAGVLLSRAFERREAIGKDFWQLVNLLLDAASIGYEIYEAKFNPKKADFSKRIDKAIRQFITGKCSIDVPSWGERSLEHVKQKGNHKHPRHHGEGDIHLVRRMPRLDVQQIQATFKSVLLPNQAREDLERERFLKFWDEALVTFLAGTRFFDEKGDEIVPELTQLELPNEYDYWVIERIAVVVGQMRPDEKPDRFWKPILGLGTRAKDRVEHFLIYWFMDVKQAIDRAAFVKEWKRMLDFCLALDSWKAHNGKSSLHLSSLWKCFLGLPDCTTSLWRDEDLPMIQEMATYFIKLSPFILSSAQNAVHYMSWLSEASAKEIRHLMLKPIAETGLAESDYWWKEQHLAKCMARYLGLLWSEHGQAFDNDPAEKRIFHSLVHKAAGTQEPLAMELQARMASRK